MVEEVGDAEEGSGESCSWWWIVIGEKP